MIVSVCADKGAPGVTDLATVMGLVWPGQRVLLEADCAGADLPFRLRHTDTDGDRLLDAQPSVSLLAADCRAALPADGVLRYAQPTTLGVPVVPGALSAEGFALLARLWPRVAQAAAGWEGTVIADLGRLQPGNPAVAMAAASTVVLVLVRPDLGGLYHLRDRVGELAASLGDASLLRSPVAVVVRARTGTAGRTAVGQVQQMLDAAGSPIPVVGLYAEDPSGIAMLREGQLTRRLLRSELIGSVRTLTETVLSSWPQLLASPARPALLATPTDGVAVAPGRWAGRAGATGPTAAPSPAGRDPDTVRR